MTLLLAQANAGRLAMADGSCHVCVTSPPYWGLRSYQGSQVLVWGGRADCRHSWKETIIPARHSDDGITGSTLEGGKATQAQSQRTPSTSAFCHHCNAWRGALGLEPTIELYAEHLVQIFREVWRVLHPSGVVFLNLGDSYVSHKPRQNATHRQSDHFGDQTPAFRAAQQACDLRGKHPHLKDKDLCNIPGRVVLALQADGWTHRDTIIWAKAEVNTDTVPMFDMPVENTLEGSAMPGSQSDRCTSAYEFIFQLTKSRHYYFDQEAEKTASGAILRNVWRMNPQSYKGAHFATFCEELPRRCISLGSSERGVCPECGEPWQRLTVKDTTLAESRRGQEDYQSGELERGKKFASATPGYTPQVTTIGWRPNCPHYPPPRRGPVACQKCGGTGREKRAEAFYCDYKQQGNETQTMRNDTDRAGGFYGGRVDTGHPCPKCDGTGTVEGDIWPDGVDDWATVPAVVLDPFAGSCTTLLVARKLGRHGVGFDLSLEYLRDQGRKRLQLDAWDEWHGRQAKGDGRGDLIELPLFASMTYNLGE